MAFRWANSAIVVGAVVGLFVVSGCLGAPLGTGVTDDEARDRALTAEESHIADSLQTASCLEDWGVGPATIRRSATVENRSGDGVSVDVTQPYWYEIVHTRADDAGNSRTEVSHADAASEATYRVTGEEAVRVQGSTIEPC